MLDLVLKPVQNTHRKIISNIQRKPKRRQLKSIQLSVGLGIKPVHNTLRKIISNIQSKPKKTLKKDFYSNI